MLFTREKNKEESWPTHELTQAKEDIEKTMPEHVPVQPTVGDTALAGGLD